MQSDTIESLQQVINELLHVINVNTGPRCVGCGVPAGQLHTRECMIYKAYILGGNMQYPENGVNVFVYDPFEETSAPAVIVSSQITGALVRTATNEMRFVEWQVIVPLEDQE